MSKEVDINRREFFKSALNRSTKQAVKYIDKKVNSAATHWIRPPFAITELEFLLSCTRCDACIDACPHDVIFPLSAKLGASVIGTPALDLINKGCHLCDDWPCVNACEAQALQFPEKTIKDRVNDDHLVKIAAPKLAFAEINEEACFPYSGPECGACKSSCTIEGALIWDQQRPIIDMEFCVGCGLCREVCIVEPSAIIIKRTVST